MNAKVESPTFQLRLSQLIMFAGVATTLAISPWSNLDPISLPKLLVLSSSGFSVLGLLLSVRFWRLSDSAPRFFTRAATLFVLWMIVVVAFSGAPINQQLWGMFGRNTGLLAYVALASLAVGCALISRTRRIKVLSSLLWTTVPINLYCFVQLAGKDPVQWSEHHTFATLGNVNFLSAFLGITSIAFLAIALDHLQRRLVRISFMVWIGISLLIVWTTGSIQGIMAFLAGFVALTFLWISKSPRKTLLFSLAIPVYAFLLVETVLGLVNRGLLNRLIYQPSVVFRGDYMHAGWAMTLKRPLFGVGMDSYGDWYREMRGEISTLRTGPDRIANTAHNVFLDLSSNGGFVLLGLYLLLLGYSLLSSYRYWKSSSVRDYIFMSIFCAWIAYQVQAAVSINQLGVGVWGWILSGLLVSYGKSAKELSNQKVNKEISFNENPFKSRAKSSRRGRSVAPGLLPVPQLLSMLFIGLIGFILAWIPLRADSQYRLASSLRDFQKIQESVLHVGATAWHYNLAIDAAVSNNLPEPAYKLTKELTYRFPRDYYGWRLLAILSNSTNEEKSLARVRMKELDPFNPENR